MAVPPAHLILISLCQLAASAASGAMEEQVGAIGGSVTFLLNFTVKQVDSVLWTFNTTGLVTIQPATESKPDTVIVAQHRNKERVAFLNDSYSLRLTKLRKDDSGVYRVEIHSSSSPRPLTREYHLRVYEHLLRPKVTVGLQRNQNGTCMTNLTCSVEQGGEEVTYSWKALGQASNESHNGPTLPVSWRLGDGGTTFVCLARNPISSNSSSPVLAWELCKDAGGDPNSTTVFLYTLPVSILLCLFVLTTVFLIVWMERRKEPIEGKKKTNIHQEIPDICPHSGETVEYDTIPHMARTTSEENLSRIIYSTVQIPKKVENSCSPPTPPDTPRQLTYQNVV